MRHVYQKTKLNYFSDVQRRTLIMSLIEYFYMENVSQEAISLSYEEPLPNEECMPSLSIQQLPMDDNLFDGFESVQDDFLSYVQPDWIPSTESNDCLDDDQFFPMINGTDSIEQTLENFVEQPKKVLDFGKSSLVVDVWPTNLTKTKPMKKKQSNKKEISLSDSVAVGQPLRSAHRIELVYPLEKTYRPRYKSDYFAQNGLKRKPRYVADQYQNHYVTLKVPTNVRGQIRVDWLTVPDAEGKQYTMPYNFQADNDSINTPDCNPLYVDINADSSGKMKLYLVLIKSKQEALRHQQPLKVFQPIFDLFNDQTEKTIESPFRLTPKKLIEKHQLGKSVLAFTLCTFGTDDETRVTEWHTTIMSTVLSEEKGAEDEAQTCITCPKCSINFVLDSNEVDETIDQCETGQNKRRNTRKLTKGENLKKKRCTINSTA